jgi:DNA invertase Pin-like site-specific DNA recombinase
MNMQVKRAAIYTRVSTMDQHPEMQERELIEYIKRRGWKLYKVYCDKGVSGSIERRPALNQLMSDACKWYFDTVLVWKLDRYGRSLRHLVNGIAELEARGIAFVSLRDNLDLSTPSGRLMMQLLGSMAEFERSLIQERVRTGLRHAQAKGKRLGRPPLRVLTPDVIAQLRKERTHTKATFRVLAVKYGVSVFTAHRLCGKHEQKL